jgi:hypothetical protein
MDFDVKVIKESALYDPKKYYEVFSDFTTRLLKKYQNGIETFHRHTPRNIFGRYQMNSDHHLI